MEQYIIKGGNPLVGEVEIGRIALWGGLYYRGKWSIRACLLGQAVKYRQA